MAPSVCPGAVLRKVLEQAGAAGQVHNYFSLEYSIITSPQKEIIKAKLTWRLRNNLWKTKFPSVCIPIWKNRGFSRWQIWTNNSRFHTPLKKFKTKSKAIQGMQQFYESLMTLEKHAHHLIISMSFSCWIPTYRDVCTCKNIYTHMYITYMQHTYICILSASLSRHMWTNRWENEERCNRETQKGFSLWVFCSW